MKLHETDIRRFNQLVSAEPDSTIYQTSFWADYMVSKGNRAVFLEADDDSGTCVALCMLLIRKESFLSSKNAAYAPFGFLINYYDEALVRKFHEALLGWLNQEKVAKLVIEPQIDLGDNSVRRVLEDLGYEKEEDLSVYEERVNTHEDLLSDPNVILRIRCIDDNSVFAKFAKDKNEKEDLRIFDCLQNHSKAYVATLDGYKSRRAIEENISQCEQFIRVHKDDYKFIDSIGEKEDEVRNLKKIFNAINKYEKDLGTDPDIAAVCVCDFSDHLTIMFKMSLDKENLFSTEKEIVDHICADCKNRGIIKIDSGDPFVYGEERKLLGRYVLEI